MKREPHFLFLIMMAASGRTSRAFAPSSHRLNRRILREKTKDEDTTQSATFSPFGNPTSEQQSSDAADVNGVGGGGGGLVSASDAKSQLFSAFAALEVTDQYDAVLTGLCAKILDTQLQDAEAAVALQDPTQLLTEMNQRKIAASPRSLMALIDVRFYLACAACMCVLSRGLCLFALTPFNLFLLFSLQSTVKTQDAKIMANILSLCARNPGGIRQYGSQQAEILAFPPNSASRALCPDGIRKTRTERLESVAPVPTDERVKEVTSALAATALGVLCFFTAVTNQDAAPYANAVLGLSIALIAVDNFYDLIKGGSMLLVKQVGKDNEVAQNFEMPDKDSLPLGIGSGSLTGSVTRGLTRLLTVDAERESQCEASALFAAYVLGLPCFAFRPNALESSVLVVESTKENELDTLWTSSGILRVLIWLMAPVAMESMSHAQLIMSDPREASGFLDRLQDVAKSDQDVFWSDSDKERADLLQWAYTEADLLLRENKAAVREISNRLAGGAATIGDCIAVIERW
jgi:hypothetical protein